MPSWNFTGKRVEGTSGFVTIFGQPMSDAEAKAQYGGKITRHHIIDIKVLQAIWNAGVDRGDEATIGALAAWGGALGLLPSSPFNMNSTDAPAGLLEKITWNPFNLVVGPLTNYRIGDPENDFDDLHFRTLPKFTQADRSNQYENLARQEFNTHAYRLRQIYLLMGQYIENTAAPQQISSMQSLLRSDTPTSYPALHGNIGTAGALLHPALWHDYSLEPNRWFIKKGDDKKYNNATKASMVPYVSNCYYPDNFVKPKDQAASVREELKAPPTGDPAVLIPTSERRLFSAKSCEELLEEKIQPLKRFATGGGLRVLICGPKEDGLFRDLLANVGGAVKQLVQTKGYRMTYSPMARPAFTATDVRIYLK